MRTPRSTYRIQVNADFTLAQVRELLPYLQQLGVSDLYLSPVAQARAGSTHGYDVTDPAHVNLEIGGDEGMAELAQDARSRGLGILLDIVPNHMAAFEANAWWNDVLEHGQSSRYAGYFDIDWQAEPPGPGRVLLPVLADEPSACLDRNELSIALAPDAFGVRYFERILPIDPASYSIFLRAIRPMLQGTESVTGTIEQVARAARDLPPRTDAARYDQRRPRAAELKVRMSALLGELAPFLPPDPGDHRLDAGAFRDLLAQQAYDLCFWLTGSRQLNYRRFFDISDLVGLRIEQPEVFRDVHRLPLGWLADGTITGVRIDHIDGLRDPAGYLASLNGTPYVVVEKILIGREQLPPGWACAGTSGYDFIGLLNGLFVEPTGWAGLGATYEAWTGITDFTRLVHDKKRLVMNNLFPGETLALADRLAQIGAAEGMQLDQEFCREAIAELTAHLPVYRTYITADVVPDPARELIEQALAAAEPAADTSVLTLLGRVLLDRDERPESWLELAARWQQFSGPVMAKGLEDTALYNYNRLISTCDVGTDPRHAITALDDFHQRMAARQAQWPSTMNASSTHDTKRGEDVRARINVLSELWPEWLERVQRWRELNLPMKRLVDGVSAPDINDELLLYQTLVGAWPLDEQELPAFRDRINAYMLKAVREAKRRTSWRVQNDSYEDAVVAFTRELLSTWEENALFRELHDFSTRVAFFGALNALSQLVIKIGAPGVPDFYQGSELWELSLVDPDNRRPVDYEARRHALTRDSSAAALMSEWQTGQVKLALTRAGLALRNAQPRLFLHGAYVALTVEGPRAMHVIAFARVLGENTAIFIASRWLTAITPPATIPTGEVWSANRLVLGPTDARSWRNVLTGGMVESTPDGRLNLAEVFKDMPVAILIAE